MKSFAKFDLRDLAGLHDAATSGNGRAEAKIAEHLRQQLAPIVKAWNAAGANSTETSTLQIEPQIRDIKFIGGKARFWAGALAGRTTTCCSEWLPWPPITCPLITTRQSADQPVDSNARLRAPAAATC